MTAGTSRSPSTTARVLGCLLVAALLALGAWLGPGPATAWLVGAALFVVLAALALIRGELVQWRRQSDVRGDLRRIEASMADVRSQQGADQAQVAQLRSQLDDIRDRVEVIHKSQIDHNRRRVVETRQLRQIESMLDLRGVIEPRGPMPLSGGYAASADLLHELVAEVLTRKPSLVVECGSGSSSLWIGYALERIGSGRLVSLEHDASWAARTRDGVAQHGLERFVEVRDAPLEDWELAGEVWPWYARSALEGLESIDILLVDGPPASVRPMSRYPAWPVLGPCMADDGIALLDDTVRPDERAVVQRWTEESETGGVAFDVSELHLYKGAARLERRP